jgi:hypothetical protein
MGVEMIKHDKLSRLGTALGVCFLAGLLVLSGCANDTDDPPGTVPPPAGEDNLDLEAENGGFTTEAEAPAFGDPALALSPGEESAIDDPVEDEPDVRDMAGMPGAKRYVLSVFWGMLENVGSPDDPGVDGTDYDWSGQLEAQKGAVVLRSVVSFERADGDSILARSSRARIAWHSSTGVGFDGIRLFLIRPRSLGSDPTEGKDSLFFQAGSYTRIFTWDELATLDEDVRVDESGNQISFQAQLVEPTTSHLGGFLRGRWSAIAEGDSVGRFEGVWVGIRGQAFGTFRGIYGTRAGGEQVFFGKYIDPDGAFLGILRGRWGVTGVEQDRNGESVVHGWFRGSWVNAENSELGEIAGHFRSREGEFGFLRGRWCRGRCLGAP